MSEHHETTHESDQAEGHHENNSNKVILVLFLGLLTGQLIKHVTNQVKLPYTPILTIFGIVVGLFDSYLGEVGTGLAIFANIDPHTMLLIFIPALIFESAFNTDWHIFKKEFFQILFLAGPCLLLSSFITAFFMRYVLWYQGEFTFSAAIMFGAIISATDPVAVVALLKEVGASWRLATLIEGESLLNDGTAMVMFAVMQGIVEGSGGTP